MSECLHLHILCKYYGTTLQTYSRINEFIVKTTLLLAIFITQKIEVEK